ncbi:MAG TPA: DUF4331 domain-containing protein [Ilumatobacteraceae bacterium]|nr:DUF4331 domain-containing protein [Ilumatobacteraceae bacterium]
MSSHREAPEISKDPVADSTDVYAFVSPDRPDSVTLISNYIPLEDPAGGPNFFEFGDDVLYRIVVDNDGDGEPDVTYEFRFNTVVENPDTFLYNTGQIATIDSPSWNRKQFYSVTRITKGKKGRPKSETLGRNLPCPPCNIGPRSTPNYAALGNAAINSLPGDIRVFAGQRLDGFYVDLGSIFDLGALRPFQQLHLLNMPGAAEGVDALRSFNVHSIAIQVPIWQLTRDGSAPTDPMSPTAAIGVYASASRRKAQVRDDHSYNHQSGPYVQVSRLGNPLFNEVIVPMGDKDRWNRVTPDRDSEFAKYVAQPELAKLLPVLYPGVFPNLAAYTADRADLLAILLTGIPGGIIPGFQNFTGTTQADLLRLNVAIPPAVNRNILGILGGDLAGFPNGRRVQDDITTIELRAIAGATIPLVDPSFTADGAAALIADGTAGPVPFDGSQPPANVSYLDTFPYLDHPKSGYDIVPLNVGAP